MKTRNLFIDIEGEQYRELLRFVRTVAPLVQLVERLGRRSTLMEELLHYSSTVRSESVSEWPGTQLLDGDRATLYLLQLTERGWDRLARVRSLYAWDGPEDLGFRRLDDSVWMATISHEQDGWMSLDEDEERAVHSALPWLKSHMSA